MIARAATTFAICALLIVGCSSGDNSDGGPQAGNPIAPSGEPSHSDLNCVEYDGPNPTAKEFASMRYELASAMADLVVKYQYPGFENPESYRDPSTIGAEDVARALEQVPEGAISSYTQLQCSPEIGEVNQAAVSAFGIDIDKLQSASEELAASAQANPAFSGVDLDGFTEETSELDSRYPALAAYPVLEACGLAIESNAPEWLNKGIEFAAGDNPTLRDYLSQGYELLCPSIFSAESATATATEMDSDVLVDCGPLTIESGSGRLTLPIGNYTCEQAETVLFDSLSAPSQPDRRVKEVTIDGHDWQCGVGGADEPYLCSTTGGDEIQVEFEYDDN